MTDRLSKLNDSDEQIVERATTLHRLMEQNRYDEGLKLVESTFDKNNPSDWYNKGNFLSNLSRTDEALECYNQATNIDKHYVKAWYRKGNILSNIQKYLEATECYEKIIDLEEENNPKNSWWSGAAAFSCMIAYLHECDNYTLAKQPRPSEIEQRRLFFENKVRQFLEANEIIPKFDNEIEFIQYCLKNANDIISKLEPSVAVEFRYKSLGIFKFNRGSAKVYYDNKENKYTTD